jgi:hypothetical protein
MDGGMVKYPKKLENRNFLVIWLIVKNKLSFRVELRKIESITAPS